MHLFTRLAWTSHIVAPFLSAVFEQQFDMLEPRMMLLAASVNATAPNLFSLGKHAKYANFLEQLLKQ